MKLFLLFLAGVAIIVGWILFSWWATGTVIDWANGHFSLGLAGAALLAVHLVAFVMFNALTSGTGRGMKGLTKDA